MSTLRPGSGRRSRQMVFILRGVLVTFCLLLVFVWQIQRLRDLSATVERARGETHHPVEPSSTPRTQLDAALSHSEAKGASSSSFAPNPPTASDSGNGGGDDDARPPPALNAALRRITHSVAAPDDHPLVSVSAAASKGSRGDNAAWQRYTPEQLLCKFMPTNADDDEHQSELEMALTSWVDEATVVYTESSAVTRSALKIADGARSFPWVVEAQGTDSWLGSHHTAVLSRRDLVAAKHASTESLRGRGVLTIPLFWWLGTIITGLARDEGRDGMGGDGRADDAAGDQEHAGLTVDELVGRLTSAGSDTDVAASFVHWVTSCKWFMKVDTDTYLRPRFYLRQSLFRLNFERPVVLGKMATYNAEPFNVTRPIRRFSYAVGGTGYTLSVASLRTTAWVRCIDLMALEPVLLIHDDVGVGYCVSEHPTDARAVAARRKFNPPPTNPAEDGSEDAAVGSSSGGGPGGDGDDNDAAARAAVEGGGDDAESVAEELLELADLDGAVCSSSTDLVSELVASIATQPALSAGIACMRCVPIVHPASVATSAALTDELARKREDDSDANRGIADPQWCEQACSAVALAGLPAALGEGWYDAAAEVRDVFDLWSVDQTSGHFNTVDDDDGTQVIARKPPAGFKGGAQRFRQAVERIRKIKRAKHLKR